MNHEDEASVAHKIMSILSPYQRNSILCKEHTNNCLHQHQLKIQNYIMQKRRIEFILPAFPAKSPNTNKTMGPRPDLGEKLALEFLNNLCERIYTFYQPGAEIIICSDGRVFNDLVNVSDNDVEIYSGDIVNILADNHFNSIKLFRLDNYYPLITYEDMRARLIEEYGGSISDLKLKIKHSHSENILFNGIHRFIYEDRLAMETAISKNQLRKKTKSIAYHVIQRSNAWSKLLENKFPNAVRLSIHPQPCGSKKMGIMMLKSQDNWATPWHRVLLVKNKTPLLIRKKEAEALGARPIYINQQFSHFTLAKREAYAI